MAPRSRKNIISNFNLMVVGFSGVGKTSFVKTLLEALRLEADEDRPQTMIEPSSEIPGPLQKTSKPYSITVETDVDGERIALTLIDTPGFQVDFQIDRQLHDIMEYIEEQFEKTLTEESKVKRNPKAIDTQVHACLYFLDPAKQKLTEYDTRILTRLATRVNVIPVIGKAETLTRAQKDRMKPLIMESIFTTHKIPIYGLPGLDEPVDDETDNTDSVASSFADFIRQVDSEVEDDETKLVLEYLKEAPFSVVAYEEDPETGLPIQMDGDIILGREYGWARVDCLGKGYSDLQRLKAMLLSTHRNILKTETTEEYYERYRTDRLLIKRATKMKSIQVGTQILQDLKRL